MARGLPDNAFGAYIGVREANAESGRRDLEMLFREASLASQLGAANASRELDPLRKKLLEAQVSETEAQAAERNRRANLPAPAAPESPLARLMRERDAAKQAGDVQRVAIYDRYIQHLTTPEKPQQPTPLQLVTGGNGEQLWVDPRNPRAPGIPVTDPTGKPVVKPKPEKPLPAKLQSDLIEQGKILDASERFTSSFKAGYGGFLNDTIGNATLAAERKGFNPFSNNTERGQWWQDYELHQSVVRNKLFGSALTAPEIAAWERSAVTPGMRDDHIKANLARRERIERIGLTRLARSSAVQYNKTAIEESIGRPIPEGGGGRLKFDANGNPVQQ